MVKNNGSRVSDLFVNLASFMRLCMFRVLSMGSIPNHIAFIMDGNRRFAKKGNMKEGAGHRAGFSALISILKYCYELGVKYVTVYAFSIDNFKRQPDEVQDLMDLMLEKIEELLEEESIVKEYGIRVYFIGNLTLLSEPVRIAAEKVMRATATNRKCNLLICIAYTSSDEIVHAVQASCKNKQQEFQPLTFGRHRNDHTEEVENIKKRNGVISHDFDEIQKHEVDESLETKASKISNGLNRRVEGGGNKNSTAVPAAQDQALMKRRTENGLLPSEESENMQGDVLP